MTDSRLLTCNVRLTEYNESDNIKEDRFKNVVPRYICIIILSSEVPGNSACLLLSGRSSSIKDSLGWPTISSRPLTLESSIHIEVITNTYKYSLCHKRLPFSINLPIKGVHVIVWYAWNDGSFPRENVNASLTASMEGTFSKV